MSASLKENLSFICSIGNISGKSFILENPTFGNSLLFIRSSFKKFSKSDTCKTKSFNKNSFHCSLLNGFIYILTSLVLVFVVKDSSCVAIDGLFTENIFLLLSKLTTIHLPLPKSDAPS